jgi:metallophosphoesterase (TIGR00282 family)
MIGDVCGVSGLEILEEKLPVLIKEKNIDFVTVNGENTTEGFGLNEEDYRRIISTGADVVTSGNHIWEKREIWPALENEKKLLRPANYPGDAPGAGFTQIEKNGINWLVINLQGREMMNAIDCPFRCFDSIVNGIADNAAHTIILVDFHAESSREKEALAYYLDGRAALIAGTHTHVQTADERVLPKGSAYITDLGMTGVIDSVIGMRVETCLKRIRTQVLYRMEIAPKSSNVKIQGIIAEINADTEKAVSITRIE